MKKSIIIFDLDGTLADNKQVVVYEMVGLLRELLLKTKAAIMSGASLERIKRQLFSSKRIPKTLLEKLFLFPSSASSCFKYKNGWKSLYKHRLSAENKTLIKRVFYNSLKDFKYFSHDALTIKIEDQLAQMTFSFLPKVKQDYWDINGYKRLKFKKILESKLHGFEVRVGGVTSVDITQKGIDKGYGIKQIEKYLKIPVSQMLFIGDSLYKGGNDYPVKALGVKCISISGPQETKRLLEQFLRHP